jgi:hypothetical protein
VKKIYSAKAMNKSVPCCLVKGAPVTIKKKKDEIMSETPANDKEMKNPGLIGPGEPGTGPEIPEADEKTIAVHKKTVPCHVERVTALRGQSIARPRQPKNALRRQSQYDIYGKDPEIPYVKFEAAARDLVCSLMERQDRMNEEIFYRINDLAYRVEDLEQNQIHKGGKL